MNVSVNTTALVQELRLINHVVAAKTALPILMNVLLRTDENGLSLSATDLEMSFRTMCRATVTEAGAVTLPAKRLLDLVEQLPPDGSVQIVTDKAHVRVMSGAFKSRLQTLPAEEFPPSAPLEGDVVQLPLQPLRTMMTRVKYAISDKTKYLINGALLTITDTLTALVATDGKRLSITTLARAGTAAGSVIIPTKTLDAIGALFSGDMLGFARSDRLLFFTAGDRLLSSRTLDGEFPKYERIVPRDSDKRATIDRMLLAAALRRVGLLAEANQATFFQFDPGVLSITSSSVQAGDAFERVPITYDGPALKVCVSWRYLLDFLDAATNGLITIDFKDSASPLLLTDGTDFVNVLIVMRL